MRRAAKIDGTQLDVVSCLREHGCKVLSLAAMAKGVPDLLISRDGYGLWLLEVKNPAGRGTALTPDQVKFHNEWPVTVVTTPEEALAAVGL